MQQQAWICHLAKRKRKESLRLARMRSLVRLWRTQKLHQMVRRRTTTMDCQASPSCPGMAQIAIILTKSFWVGPLVCLYILFMFIAPK